MKQLTIDPAFQALIPSPTGEELHSLTECILQEGVRDTVKTWKGTIIDGHNRYAICQKHNIPFKTEPLRFRSKKDATLWIIENQLGRRNLSKATRIKLAAHKMEMLHDVAQGNRGKKDCEPVHVRKTIAAEAGVSEQTVYRYMRILAQAEPGVVAQVDKGELKIGTAYSRLDVVMREVEVWFDGRDLEQEDSPKVADGVVWNIGVIGGVYEGVAQGGEWDGEVWRMLMGQRGVLDRVMGKC